MKSLYLIRHAKSSWKDLSLRDFDRPLNKRGKRDAPFMAQKLKEFGVRPDAILTSPANRALTTARFFASYLEVPAAAILQEETIYEAYTSTLLKIIQGQAVHLETILMFGHNPGFTALANLFSGAYIANVPTCGIVKIIAEIDKWEQLNPSTGRKAAFYYPKQYFGT